jgi:hypothetical protein
MAGFRKRSPVREWSPWDKAFWSSVGVLIFTIITYGVYMYVEGITNPLENYGGALGTIMQIDKVFGFGSFVSTILTPLLRRLFE